MDPTAKPINAPIGPPKDTKNQFENGAI